MEHNISLITTLAAGFSVALVLGFLAERIKVPALVGYLVAGIIIGPGTPGFVADVHLASQLSEIGVMLLMFGVGLHFSLNDLLAVKRIAVPGAVVQMSLATVLGMAVAWWWGWSWGAGLIFGLSLSCASTVVLLKALEARGVLESMNGRIAVGWLVVEDLATVLVLVLLPPLAGVLGGSVVEVASTQPLWITIGKTLLQVGAFIAIMLVAGRRVLPWLLWQISRTGSRELFTLSVVVAAIGIAYGAAQLFSVSFALGAFFAGMVMRESEFSQRAAEESLPLRDAFSVLFFVSVGMLFEPSILMEQPVHVLGVVAIIILGKSIAAFGLVLAFRYPLNTALTVSASLAQIGEFSFILCALAVAEGLLPASAQQLVVAGALVSIALNPLLFAAIEPLQRWIRSHSRMARLMEQRVDPLAELPMSTDQRLLTGQVVIVGFGRVGRRLAERLRDAGIPFVVADQNRERIEALRAEGQPAVFGDATEPATLIQAHVARAAMMVIALPDSLDARQMIEVAKLLNPKIQCVVRTHNEDEAELLRAERVGEVFMGEQELARAIGEHVVTQMRTRGNDTAAAH
ncbi:MAG TPA: YbaL family putative K(+) efflux transporter [Patescibacteria group bacterium]|nr:YbaL family putative K(+) efflux transporter [Patescibacteria group bacterium]